MYKLNKEGHFQLEECSGKLYVNCLPCSGKKKKLVEAGPREKSLSNLKAHVKTSKHQANVEALSEARKQAASQRISRETTGDKEKALAQINELHREMFEELANSKEKMVRCTICNHLISTSHTNPNRGKSARRGRAETIETCKKCYHL